MKGSECNQRFWAPAMWALGTLRWAVGRDSKARWGGRRAAPSHAVLVQMLSVTTVPGEEKSLPRLQPSPFLVSLHPL